MCIIELVVGLIVGLDIVWVLFVVIDVWVCGVIGVIECD